MVHICNIITPDNQGRRSTFKTAFGTGGAAQYWRAIRVGVTPVFFVLGKYSVSIHHCDARWAGAPKLPRRARIVAYIGTTQIV